MPTTRTAALKYVDGDTVYELGAAATDAIDVAGTFGTDTASIQATIDVCNANYIAGSGPMTAYLRPGEWTSTGVIFMKSGVTLAGAGRQATTILKSGIGPAIAAGHPTHIYSNDPNRTYLEDATIRDLTLDCDAQTVGVVKGFGSKGIYFTHVKRGTFTRLEIKNSQYSAFGLDYPSDHTIISDCIVRDTKIQAVDQGGNGYGTMSGMLNDEDFAIVNCTAIGVRSGVVIEIYETMIEDGKGPRITDCLSLDCQHGFENAGVAAATFDSCIALRSTISGFKFGEGDHSGLDFATGAATMDNCFAMDGVIGVEAYFETPAAAELPGLVIQNSVVRDNSSHGVLMTLDDFDVQNFTVRNNTVSGNGGYGVAVAKIADGTGAIVDLSVVGNDIIDNTLGGVRLNADLTRGRVETNNIIDTTGSAQPVGISIPTGRTLTGTAFGGGLIKATTPVSIVGTLTGCHVGHVPGWTSGTGAPTIAAPVCTIYQRTDGTSGTLLYVNTNGGTTWAAFA